MLSIAMKNTIALGMLSVFIASAGCTNLIPQRPETISARVETFETFAEWCLNQDSLSPEARHTVAVLCHTPLTLNKYS